MASNESNDYLHSLASIHEEIVKLISVSVPYPEWLQAIFLVQANPVGDTYSIQFIYFLKDGAEVRRKSPEDQFMRQFYSLIKKQLDITRSAKQLWFRMTIVVKNTGKWRIDFKYRDHYEEGDIGKWDLPDFGKGEI